MRRRLLPVVAALGLGVACTSGGATGPGPGAGDDVAAGEDVAGIPVVLDEYEFEPGTVKARAGEITFVVDNAGTLGHDLSIDGAGFSLAARAGQTEAGTIELSPGTYTIYCSVAGHRAAGMEGTLTVR